MLVGGLQDTTREIGLPADLTPREEEILALMAQGLSNSGIAEQLFLSCRTVESHARAIFRKLDIAERAEVHRRVIAARAYWSHADHVVRPLAA